MIRRIVVIVVALALVACSSDSKPNAAPGSSASSSAAEAKPGTVSAQETVAVPDMHGTLLRITYHSRSVKDADIEVTGLVAIPSTPPPAGGYPVISFAHGTTGIADECAPSRNPESEALLANALLDKGYLVVATDYEGLGT